MYTIFSGYDLSKKIEIWTCDCGKFVAVFLKTNISIIAAVYIYTYFYLNFNSSCICQEFSHTQFAMVVLIIATQLFFYLLYYYVVLYVHSYEVSNGEWSFDVMFYAFLTLVCSFVFHGMKYIHTFFMILVFFVTFQCQIC